MNSDYRWYGGVDPGSQGAFAFLGEDDEVLIYDIDDLALLESLRGVVESDGPNIVKVLIEQQWGRPGQASKSTFSLGSNYRRPQAWLELIQVGFFTLTPTGWWKEARDSSTPKIKAVDSKLRKEASMKLARRYFPKAAAEYLTRKMDHNRAEALLMAYVCRKLETGKPVKQKKRKSLGR